MTVGVGGPVRDDPVPRGGGGQLGSAVPQDIPRQERAAHHGEVRPPARGGPERGLGPH